jgi:hypothetical protein
MIVKSLGVFAMLAFLAGCGGGSSSSFVGGSGNYSLSGNYAQVGRFFDSTATQPVAPATGSPLPAPLGFVSASATTTFDGAGGWTSSVTFNADGTPSSLPSASGAYSVASDGTLTIVGAGETGAINADGSMFITSGDGGGDPEIDVGIKKNGSGLSLASLIGTYGLVGYRFNSGTTQSNAPAQGSALPAPRGFTGESGSISFDGIGGWTSSIAVNLDGVVQNGVTSSGSYVVSPSGDVTISTISGFTINLMGVMRADGSVMVLSSSSSDPEVAVAIKKDGTTLSTASLHGSYNLVGYKFRSSTVQSNMPAPTTPLPPPLGFVSELGTVSYDGSGNWTLSTTNNTDGTASASTSSGTYAVSSIGDVSFTRSSPTVGSGSGTMRADGSVLLLASGSGDPEIMVAIRR